MKKNYGLYLQLLCIQTTKQVAKRQFITKQVHYYTFFNTKAYLCLYIATFVA